VMSRQARGALPARCDRTYEYAIADLKARHSRAELFNYADWFVTDSQAGFDGILAANNVNIGAADCRERYAYHCFANARVRPWNLFDSDFIYPAKYQGFHSVHLNSPSNHSFLQASCPVISRHHCVKSPIFQWQADCTSVDSGWSYFPLKIRVLPARKLWRDDRLLA